MSAPGCLDNGCQDCGCQCDACEGCCEALRQHRNPLSSVTAGILFALGWWFLIDGTVNDHIEKKHQAIGTMSTVGMFMVNAISAEMLNSGYYSDGVLGPVGARVWLVLGLVMSFGCLISATWMMVEYINDDRTYAGVCVFVQNILIFISSVIFKFGRGDPYGSYGGF
eukprot:m.73169 g.73169  ORF g.73169 m.73169 type:complete len:167 (-) comp14313_c0_seq1:1882-2382(-)